MEWAVVEEAAVAQLFGSPTSLESKSGSPSFGAVLFTYFLEYQTSDFKATRTRSSALFDSIKGENSHFYLIFALTLFWHNLKHISLYHVLVCVSLVTAALFIFVNYLAFLFLENDIKWIAKEARLLTAIVKDAEGITVLTDRIRSKANEVWDSELDSGVATLGLNESEVAWVDKTRNVALEAEDLVDDFESKRKREIILRKISFSMLDFMEVEALFKRIRQVKDDINGSIAMKNVREIDVCESLEKSWSTIRKLLDRPIEDEQENKWVISRLQVGQGGFISPLVGKVHSMVLLIKQIKDSDGGRDRFPLYFEVMELHLKMLDPFLQYVEGLQLESEIGKAWLKEVDEIADEAKFAIDAFSKATAYRARWLGVPRLVKTWKARRKLEASVKRIDIGFSELFQRKERYGFKFIIRDSSKSSKYHDEDVREKVLYVVKDIRNFLDHARLHLGWVSGKLKLLCDELENVCKLLDDAEATYAGINSLGKAWLEEMEKVAKIAAESKKAFWNNSVSIDGSFHRLRSTRARLQLSRGIDQIKHQIHVIERSITAYSIELREESSSIVGLEEDVDALVSQLTAESGDEDCSCDVFSIVGMEGIGKTTLAKKVYSHRAILNRFPIRVWVNVPKKCDNKLSFLEDVGKQILGWRGLSLQQKISPGEEEEYLKTMVCDFLSKNRYLLVLDNVSTKEALDSLVRLMVFKASKECRVVLITRNEEVASLADHHSSGKLRHRIRLRTKDESLSLLKQMVYISSGEETTVEDIVSGCLGLPLSIVRVGYMMLKQEVTASEALVTVPLLKSAFNETDKELPPNLKPLLEHFELFPRDFEIPARRLITLWVSEGLVTKSREENQTLEQVAEKRLSELIDHGIVQVVKRKASGKVRTCCLPITTQPRFLQFPRDSPQNIKDIRSVQRLAHRFNNKNHLSFCLIHSSSTRHEADRIKLHSFFPYDPREEDEPGEDTGFFLSTGIELCDNGLNDWISLDYRKLSSYLSFDPREGNEPGEKIGNFLRRGIERGYFKGLHVLDLERVFRPELPNNIGKLKNLRYLGLRWTYLQNIPPSIGELVHLETLDLKHTYVHTLPSSVWKLQELRHLYLNQRSRTKFTRHPGGSSSLKCLETLWGGFVDKNSPLKDCLDKMTNLRKLGLAFQLDTQEQRRRLADRILKLKRLQHLRLRSIDESSKPGKLFLKLSGLGNLSSLDLFGTLENPLVIDELPKKLTELTLSATNLSNDPMSKLGKLLNLKLLCMYSNSYRGRCMAFSDEDFPKLLVLKLWKLEELEELAFHENSLRKLRELEIRSCNKLKVPVELKNLKTLLELKLTTMPEEFVREIDNIKGQIWSNTTRSPSIKIIDNL
ncbi:hypothetical protein TIFTF001_006363 [Ficus carica]|uniref:Uncharacterized protein n=1 Tax=Ficus carica TaxID=3494 RepID=A0AA87ZIN4_FICCA|nr:hypothetical protein TIFTF001_006363 [Ficus carica]